MGEIVFDQEMIHYSIAEETYSIHLSLWFQNEVMPLHHEISETLYNNLQSVIFSMILVQVHIISRFSQEGMCLSIYLDRDWHHCQLDILDAILLYLIQAVPQQVISHHILSYRALLLYLFLYDS